MSQIGGTAFQLVVGLAAVVGATAAVEPTPDYLDYWNNAPVSIRVAAPRGACSGRA
jgi:hypothetical protein